MNNNWDTFLLGVYQFTAAMLFVPIMSEPSWLGWGAIVTVVLNVLCGVLSFVRYATGKSL